MIHWQTCKKDFEWDGSWRDIYVFKTTLDDWRALCACLRAAYELGFQIDGITQPFPPAPEEVFAIRKQGSPLLRVRVGGILVACHFFTPEQMEFDIDPREVTSQSDLDALLGFLRRVGDAVGKPVAVTP
jgi:hypothetical protein